MGYEFDGLGTLVVIGLVAILVFALPGASAAIAVLVWRIVTADWSLIVALVGAGIGALPALALGIALLWFWIRG